MAVTWKRLAYYRETDSLPNLTQNKAWKGDASNRPAEVDWPTGAGNAAFGTYTGDGTADRQITVGFACSLVIIQRRAASSVETYIVLNTEGSDCICVVDTDSVDDWTHPYLHATDGFVVTTIRANTDGETYAYAAFGA